MHQERLEIPQPIQLRPQQSQHLQVFEEENISNLDVSNIEDNTSPQKELHYFLRNLSNKIKQAIDQEMIEDTSDEEDDELLVNLDNDDIEPEDLQRATLGDALDSIEGNNNSTIYAVGHRKQ
ncbi:3749_t:CDS:2 [Racocetra fulgida]|uniref:3749_t:CDS:1 n=1 Tax=Racocetra fulgida TaxID=60492 RepID=A0A9N9B9P5_9GLOM|nr:3749_t:CDS:2 [Racocetra fulgida]